MNLQHFTDEADVGYTQVEDGGAVEHVVDLGSTATRTSVDVVDGTVIVVFEGRTGNDQSAPEQYEIDSPGHDPEAFIRNGVLTIRTEDTA